MPAAPSLLIAAALGAAGAPSAPPTGPVFADVAAESGLDFVHWNGMSGELYYAEMMGPGGALLDYDGDGDLDAYLLQGAMLGAGKRPEDATVPPPPGPLIDRLFRNDLTPDASGQPRPRFVDVTARSGIAAAGYGMAVATADVDADGNVDLFVGNLGRDELWLSRGDGTFEDATERAGVGDPRWTAAATFADLDGDALLDLFVARYVVFDPEKSPRCYAATSRRDYCGPDAFAPLSSSLYRGRGGGRFEDVSVPAGIAAFAAPALGVVAADLDGDRRLDLYVTNDGRPNFLYLNRGDGSFREDALFSGVAVDGGGAPEASMGVAAEDLDDDGDVDLYLTHLEAETDTLYVNDGRGLFTDRTVELGLSAGTLAATSFGVGTVDVDLDGWIDLVIASGAVRIREDQAAAGSRLPLAEAGSLWHSREGRGFESWSGQAGQALTAPTVGRGLATGDIDGDGAVDALLVANGAPVRLLHNQLGGERGWVGVRILDAAGADALGATVAVRAAGERRRFRRVHSDGSYSSASDPRIVVGLGASAGPVELEVRWPDGRRRRLAGVPARRTAVVAPGHP